MGNITLKDITPIHFLNAVRLLKSDDYQIYCTLDSVEIRFSQKRFLTQQESDERFDFCYALKMFLDELKNSTVPVDKDDFLKEYSPVYRHGKRYFRR
ncbi:hypothetical protein [Aggregatibacter actinomycetemcomitans]|uniref:hypothetical protein n=1 Tax=Aggregatibacter actinomycetemcomitans TaxID=714 RepID=UPI00197B18F1|nr:hypothetical protein [Aggregatibacter actinomycetemcomitans]MBN6076304.1 hypothetical protein [Aggregatibacter actinomycetemcomitans]MBN6078793.1 hypothetical protein [Aggregatibacter actinomycetemcomitans]